MIIGGFEVRMIIQIYIKISIQVEEVSKAGAM